MRRVIVLSILVVLLIIGMAEPAEAGRYAATSIEIQTVQLINTARSSPRYCGDKYYEAAKPVKIHGELTYAARKHSKDMAIHNFFSHYNLRGWSPFKRIRKAGYDYRTAGENIAAGQDSPPEVVDAWLNSPGHCKIIMNSRYKHVGLGHVYYADSRWKQYWTANFARPD